MLNIALEKKKTVTTSTIYKEIEKTATRLINTFSQNAYSSLVPLEILTTCADLITQFHNQIGEFMTQILCFSPRDILLCHQEIGAQVPAFRVQVANTWPVKWVACTSSWDTKSR